jgi:hypothetical protein
MLWSFNDTWLDEWQWRESMKGHSRWWIFVSLAVLLILAVGGGIAFALLRPHPTPSPPQTTVVWKASSTGFSPQDQQAIKKLVQADHAVQAKNVPHFPEIDIITANREGDWATFTTQQITAKGEVWPTEPGFFVAHKQNSAWSSLEPGTYNFCTQLQQVPDTLLTSTDKRYFCQP